MRRASIVCVVALLSACSVRDGAISDSLTQLVIDDRNVLVDLGKLGGPDWDRVCFVTPYMTSDGAEKVLGFPWDSDKYTSIKTNDGVVVLVLVKGDRVVSFAEHPRGSGDLSEVGANCLQRANAKLKRVRGADGWLRLKA